MKKLSLVLVAILIAITGIMAQTPNQFKYQAVLRDAGGQIMADEAVTVDISILQGSASGTSVFDEQHNVTTTAQGLINLNIGSVADLSVVDFSSDIYFVEISVNDVVMGTSQLLSVPYALQAKEVENVDYSQITNTPLIPEDIADLTDNSNLLFSGDYNDLTNLPTLFDGDWSSLINTPTTISGYGITDAFDGDYNSLSNLPTLFDGEWSSLLNTPTTISGYGITDAFSGSYTDLTNKPANATTTTDGFMSSADKKKLDGLENANIRAGTGISVTGTYPDLTITNTATGGTHYLGEEYLGGIIFYLYIGSDGQQHGLVVSKTETTAKWQNTGTTTNATRSWDGSYNTGQMTDSPAKTWVTGLGADWYLPSIDELSLLWHNRFHVNNALNSGGYTLLSNTASYWSSTECNATYAYDFNFRNGYVNFNFKTNPYSVRGVRAF